MSVMPRPYQEWASSQVLARLRDGHTSLLVVTPSGSGVSVIWANIVSHRHQNTVILIPDDTPMESKVVTFIKSFHTPPRYEVMPQKGEFFPTSPVVFATLSQWASHPERFADYPQRMVADCHRWGDAIFKPLRDIWSEWRSQGVWMGWSVTEEAWDGTTLWGVDAPFEIKASHVTIHDLQKTGDALPLLYRKVVTQETLSGGRWGSLRDIAKSADILDYPERNVRVMQTLEHQSEGRPGVVIAGTSQHAMHLAEEGRKLGLDVIAWPETDQSTQYPVLKAMQSQHRWVVLPMDVATQLTDPAIQVIVMATPTTNVALYESVIQIGLLMYPNASDCLIVDIVDQTRQTFIQFFDLMEQDIGDWGMFGSGGGAISPRRLYRWTTLQVAKGFPIFSLSATPDHYIHILPQPGQMQWDRYWIVGQRLVTRGNGTQQWETYVVDPDPLPLIWAFTLAEVSIERTASQAGLATPSCNQSLMWHREPLTMEQLKWLRDNSYDPVNVTTKGECAVLYDEQLLRSEWIWVTRHPDQVWGVLHPSYDIPPETPTPPTETASSSRDIIWNLNLDDLPEVETIDFSEEGT